MPKHIPFLKPRELIRLLEQGGCRFHREGKGDHRVYIRYLGEQKRIVPIDMGAKEFSPPYVIRIFRQFVRTLGDVVPIIPLLRTEKLNPVWKMPLLYVRFEIKF